VVIVIAVLPDLPGKMTHEQARIRHPVPIFAIGHAAEWASVPGGDGRFDGGAPVAV
jgi:hypothetical protein